MTTRQQAGIVLAIGIIVVGAIATQTQAQSQSSLYECDTPSVFDGVLSNVAALSLIHI